MLVFHPINQSLAILLVVYVFYLGLQRFRFLHLHQRAVFRWKRHVVLGVIALAVLLAGMLVGMAVVYMYWRQFIIMGVHAKVALMMVPFIVFGLGSGLYMNHRKKNPRLFIFIHGLNNLVVLIFALSQVVSGLWIYKTLVSGS